MFGGSRHSPSKWMTNLALRNVLLVCCHAVAGQGMSQNGLLARDAAFPPALCKCIHDSVLSHVCDHPDFVHPDAMPLAEAPLRLRRQAVGLQQSRRKLPQPVPEFKRIVNLPKSEATPMMKCLSLTVRGGIDEKGLRPITTVDA
eukprot:6211570-Amphidinium_carterae.1